ncbi:hypothetical protein [Sulfurimonas sp.]|uniref:hypothetical protein n=1 Tax=Sulfurimonas sp. TaxID=2022749 RepID=UPI0025E4FA23|nr:hypothetical protein [Sulfurimonas sp.]MCK9454227.1 hypothetical protein [Sulfurimonas sp.]
MKIIIGVLALIFSVFADSNTTKTHKYLLDKQPEYTQKFTCPAVKEGYSTRIYSVDYWSGTTTCLIYDHKGLLNKVQRANPLLMGKMQESLKKIKDDAIIPKTRDNGVDRYKSIKNIRENYLQNYTSDSGGYLNLPSFLIAGLTLDNKVIDIPLTVSTNTVKLQSGYTLYPNSYINYDVENESHNLFMGTMYRIGNGLAGLVGWDAGFGEKVYTKLAEEDVSIFSSTKEMLTNIIIFIIQFLERYNPTMLEIKTFLLFTIVPVTTLFLVTSKATKKLSKKVQDKEDVWERAVVSGIALFCFYFTTNTVKIDDESTINQVNYQNWYREILRSGSGFADSVGEAALDAFILYKTRDVGIVGENLKRDLVIQKKMLEEENKFLSASLQNGCYDSYNLEEVRNYVNFHTSLNLPFPPSETIRSKDGSVVNWYSENFLKTSNPSVSISGCAVMYKREKENKELLKEIDMKMHEVADATNDRTINEQMEHLAKMQYRNFGELGWIATPMIATTDAVMKQLDHINNQAEKLNRQAIARDRELAGATPESNANIPSSLDDDLLKNVPYVLIPGFSSIKNEISGFFQKIPSLPDSGFFKNFAKFQSLGLDIVAYFWTLSIIKFGVAMFPFVMLLTASLLVIGFWAISVLLYYMVTPFLVAFAMASQQGEVIKKFLKTGVFLAFKPLMLVISIVIAIFATEFLGNLNNLLIDWNFDNLKFLFTKVDTELMYLMILKEFLHIVNSIVIAFLAFYLVFNGSDMILNLIGLKDVSVDVQTSVGDKIDNKSSKYST